MKALELVGVEKSFEDNVVLTGVDLAVERGSVTALLGPSGSGKTTVLRIVAGFERADRGSVTLAGRVVDDASRALAPERRRVGYVPQEGALFPHLRVARNVGFGLGRRAPKARVDELLEMVGLAGLGSRFPHQLSGGQQQRVALARALAVSPEAILLDEPFASLDAELRASVRADVLGVLRAAGTTTLFVTHDQEEALAAADRVAVLRAGRIAQAATPRELYVRPADPDIARFLGAANVVRGTFGAGGVRTALGLLAAERVGAPAPGAPALVLIRPEQLALVEDPGRGACTGEVLGAEFLGHDLVVRVAAATDPPAELVARVPGEASFAPGAAVGLSVTGTVRAWVAPVPTVVPAEVPNESSTREITAL